MVNASVRTSANGVTDALEDRELMAVIALAALGAGGFILAQEVVDQVLPRLGMSADPSSPSELGMSAIVKLLGGLVFVAIASRGSTTVQAVAGVLAYGMLVSMGADLFDVLQRGGIPFNTGGSRSSPSPSRSVSSGSSSQSSQVQRVQPARRATAGGSSYR